MRAGDRVRTAVFGTVAVSAVYESEERARADGYYYDAHVKTGSGPEAEWKVLYDGCRFAAARCPTGLEEGNDE